jgi:hypothetical protein
MAILLVPGVAGAVLLHSPIWLLVVPALLLVLWAAVGKWGPKRKVTPQGFANELERHLQGNEGPWDWDDTTSVSIADERLERLRVKLSKFDTPALPEWREEFVSIINTLRRGEVPEVKDDY